MTTREIVDANKTDGCFECLSSETIRTPPTGVNHERDDYINLHYRCVNGHEWDTGWLKYVDTHEGRIEFVYE